MWCRIHFETPHPPHEVERRLARLVQPPLTWKQKWRRNPDRRPFAGKPKNGVWRFREVLPVGVRGNSRTIVLRIMNAAHGATVDGYVFDFAPLLFAVLTAAMFLAVAIVNDAWLALLAIPIFGGAVWIPTHQQVRRVAGEIRAAL